MSHHLLHAYEIVAVFYTAIISWTFVLMYHVASTRRSTPWWRDRMGRHVMAFVAVDAIVFSFLATAYIWPVLGTYDWYLWAYLIIGISGIPWVVTWRVVISVRIWRETARNSK